MLLTPANPGKMNGEMGYTPLMILALLLSILPAEAGKPHEINETMHRSDSTMLERDLQTKKTADLKLYKVLVSKEAIGRAEKYLTTLKLGAKPGGRLRKVNDSINFGNQSIESFLELLMATKVPQIFAESAVFGDGTDWNLQELSILGDLCIAVPVVVFDDGLHSRPKVHKEPFAATLLFVPGSLLQNGMNKPPVDWEEVTRNGRIDRDGFFQLYNRRLLPALMYANEVAGKSGKKALVTIPGLGCGLFAGPFKGKLGIELQIALKRILETHGRKLSNISCLYFDPYSECENERTEINGVTLLTRPLTLGNPDKPQLCRPQSYAEAGDDFSDCELFSVVAWDHVSWPGNDFYVGSRCTDDGVKAAATDAIAVMTGVEGKYDSVACHYLPPSPYQTWNDVVEKLKLQIIVTDRLIVYPK